MSNFANNPYRNPLLLVGDPDRVVPILERRDRRVRCLLAHWPTGDLDPDRHISQAIDEEVQRYLLVGLPSRLEFDEGPYPFVTVIAWNFAGFPQTVYRGYYLLTPFSAIDFTTYASDNFLRKGILAESWKM